MSFFKWLFSNKDHEDGSSHTWSRWSPMVVDIMRVFENGQTIQGQKSVQVRECNICGRVQREDIES